ncbi:MAG: sigma-70 family RNA polymerase sigma factor [Betaproteobacteria bacterium]|nr:sigma-70 family RNA polymerase sigma factor [Betaproteobacteria bacterium]
MQVSIPAQNAVFQQHRPPLSSWGENFATSLKAAEKYGRKFAQFNPSLERSECEQVARIALWSAKRSFDATRGRLFSRYAKVCVKHALWDYSTECIAHRDRHVSTRQGGEDEEALEQDGIGVSPFDARALTEPEVAQMASQIMQCVDKRGAQHLQVFSELIQGRTQGEIGRALGVTQQRVARVKAELVALLENTGIRG